MGENYWQQNIELRGFIAVDIVLPVIETAPAARASFRLFGRRRPFVSASRARPVCVFFLRCLFRQSDHSPCVNPYWIGCNLRLTFRMTGANALGVVSPVINVSLIQCLRSHPDKVDAALLYDNQLLEEMASVCPERIWVSCRLDLTRHRCEY
jgi:hypothetical protein